MVLLSALTHTDGLEVSSVLLSIDFEWGDVNRSRTEIADSEHPGGSTVFAKSWGIFNI